MNLMMNSPLDDELDPIEYPGHDRSRSDCSCDLCKFERFVLVLDRIEAEQTQKEFDENILKEETD